MYVSLDDRVKRWFEQSERERSAATTLQCAQPHLACFHSQQAIGAALKALLTRIAGDSPRTHLNSVLVRALGARGVPLPELESGEALESDQYYLPTRYTDAVGFADPAVAFGPRSAAVAVRAAALVVWWVSTKLQALGPARMPEIDVSTAAVPPIMD